MELKGIVLHKIVREENKKPELFNSDHLLDVEDNTIIDFVDKLVKSFSARRPTYGAFETDSVTYPFQNRVKDYLKEDDFLDFSIRAMSLLEKEIQVPGAKGGYVVFIHYSHNTNEFLITTMLDKSEQFGINDESLDINRLLTLDIEKQARANRLNITKWNNNEELYLSFIKGTRDVSRYFQKFIGNTDLTSSRLNVKNLNDAVEKYMREGEYSYGQKDKVRRGMKDYFEDKFSSDEDVQLISISAIIDQANPENFMNFVHDNDIEVSGSFRISNKTDYKVLTRAVYVGNGINLEFEKNLIQQGKISREGNNILIKDLPTEFLDREFGDN